MPTYPFLPVPDDLTPEKIEQQASLLVDAATKGDAATLSRIGPHLGDPRKISHQDAIRALAREYGFSDRESLDHFLSERHAGEHTQSSGPSPEQLANWFLDLSVLRYESVPDHGPERFSQALSLLEKNPQLLKQNVYVAAACGDIEALQHWLTQSPEIVNRKGGLFHWEPILYAAYARLPERSTLAVARVLLDHGADPNAFFMWNGQYRFTALTGAFGEGEQGRERQPQHPDYQAFCRALLEKGANPNDGQALYNRCFEPDNTCLELLLEFGLSPSEKNNWYLLENDELQPHPSETLHFQLIHAIKNGFMERVRLLVEAGVDLEKPDNTYETRTKNKAPLEVALVMGQQEIADYLIEQGAPKNDIPALSHLQCACLSGNESAARELLDKHAHLATEMKPLGQEMLADAVKACNAKAVELMLTLGFELNDNSRRTPLHEAALSGRLDIVKQLVNAGADTKLRDPHYHQPPLGFALHAEHHAIVEYLDQQPMDIFTAAIRGNLGELQSRIAEDPASVHTRFSELGDGNADENGWMTPLVYAAMGGQAAALRLLMDHGADVGVSRPDGVSVLEIAKQENASEEVVGLLKRGGS